MELTIGIDVSHWDPILDWKAYTWKYAFIKVSEGTFEDSKFQEQWSAARGYVIRGPYHWFHYFVNPVLAVEKMAEYLGSDPGELPPVLDLEDDDGHPELVAPKALDWLRECKRLFRRSPIVYSSWGFADRIKMKNYQEFTQYPLWLAQYPWDKIEGEWTEEKRTAKIRELLDDSSLYVYPNSFQPYLGKPTWVQWTGKCPPEFIPGYPLGQKEAVDINFYNGSLEQLKAQFNIGELPPREDDDMDKPITWRTTLKDGQRANLRLGPGLTAGIIKTVTGPIPFEGTGQRVFRDNYYWGEVVNPEPCWIAFTTSFEPVEWITPTPTTKRIVKSVIHYDDNSTEELFPQS